jgi:hypothetical protein
MLILYKGLIRSVLEYGCIAFDRMAGTHMLKLEKDRSRPDAIDSSSDALGYSRSGTIENEIFDAKP